MSVMASINIKLVHQLDGNVSSIDIFNNLVDYGWTLNDEGMVSFLPLGDNDNFDWKRENINKEFLVKILKEKEKANEVIGIVMTWKDTGIGGQFLMWSGGNISINLTLNRKLQETDKINITDYNWYFNKLISAINNNNLIIESFSCEEHV